MKILYFATSNKWKFSQAKDYFSKHGLNLLQFDCDLPESREEDGKAVAEEKSRAAFAKLGKPVFVVDGSFQIKALKDFPKSYVKFFDKYIGAKGLLKLLDGEKDRRWEFLNILYFRDKNREKCFVGTTRGVISKTLIKTNVIKVRDFERVMIPEESTKTFSQMTEEEYKAYDKNIWKPNVFLPFISWFKNR
jgi:XTP/dITP diphosphohydrolase